MTEKTFPQGLFIKEVETKYGTMQKLSFKTEEAIKWLQENTNNAVNVDVKRSKDGNKPYLELNTYVAPVDSIPSEKVADNMDDDNINDVFDDSSDLPF